MTFPELSRLRMLNQQIEGSVCTSPKELLSSMGAIQAQDFAMAKWAIGQRIPDSTRLSIETAYDAGNIIRTHLMRPTWHLVSSDDIYWMLELTAPQIRKILKTNDKRFELTDQIYAKTNTVLENVLSNNCSMTREELVQEFENVHIRTDENRLSHILMRAELDGVVCSGPIRKNKLTYALLADRVPLKKTGTRDESLFTLAGRYFSSHGPATLRDFVWWSGLGVTEARKALEMIKAGFLSETIGTETYWFAEPMKKTLPFTPSVHLLPAYDEYLISYANRSAALAIVNNKKTISDNGIFRPVIVIDGQVEGLWKRTTIKDKVKIETSHFKVHDSETIRSLKKEATRYGIFLDKKIDLVIQDLTLV